MNALAQNIEPAEQQADGEAMSSIARLMAFMQMENIAPALEKEIPDGDERSLGRIASRVVSEYEIDKESCKDWQQRNQEALDLARLVSEQKDYPFPNASNVKYPLLTTAALQFNARCYPAIVQGGRVAKCKTWGDDPNGIKAARAERVSEHLSFQLLSEMPEWEPDTDKLTVMLPLTGCMFRKVYFDPALQRNASRLLPPDRLVMHYHARSVTSAPRITEELFLYPYEIEERIRSGRFVQFDYDGTNANKEGGQSDDFAPHEFLEQHRLIDLDDDGYPEPYIVTVHKPTETVVRIVANYDEDSVNVDQDGQVIAIRRNEYFIQYEFLPSIDGGVYGLGLGYLLKDTTEAINTTLNQMLDAGHLANVQGGFTSAAANIREKSIRLSLGEWRVLKTNVPLNQALYPVKYDGPSPVLFQLLGFMIESGKEVSAIKDILTGEVRQNMTASATLALIEQGLQVFTSIFKRIHRSLKAELGLYADLNRKNLAPERYNALFDAQEQFDPAADYDDADMDTLPVSDPNVSSRMQELAKANFLREVGQGNPMMNPMAVTRRVLEAAQIENVEELLAEPQQPDPVVEEMMLRNAMLDLEEKEADVVKKMASAMKDMASAEAEDDKPNIARYALMLKALEAELKAENGQGRFPAMEGQPGNPMGNGSGAGASLPDAAGLGTGTGPIGNAGDSGLAEPPIQGGI